MSNVRPPENDQAFLRLPRWARDELTEARRKIPELQEQVTKMLSGSIAGTTVYIERGFKEDIPLPDDTRICCRSNDRMDFIEVYFENGKAIVRGGYGVSVRPMSGNMVEVKNERFTG